MRFLSPLWCSSVLPLVVFSFCMTLSSSAFAASKVNIKTCSDLQAIKPNTDIYYVLKNDIDCSATNPSNPANRNSQWNNRKGFIPINNFIGELDGRNHKITGLFINNSSVPTTSQATGLFGLAKSGAIVYDLVLENIVYNGQWNWYTGGLIGHAQGRVTVTNVRVVNAMLWGGTVGGVIGMNDGGSIINSSANVNIVGAQSAAGGLVASNYRGVIKNSFAEGKISGVGDIGGLVGWNYGGTIQQSYSKAKVVREYEDRSKPTYLGGLVGFVDNRGGRNTIEKSYAAGNISLGTTTVGVGTYSLGGAIGGISNVGVGTFNTVYFDPKATGQTRSAGGAIAQEYPISFQAPNETPKPEQVFLALDRKTTWKEVPVVQSARDRAFINARNVAPFSESNFIRNYVTGPVRDYPHLKWESLEDTAYYQEASGGIKGWRNVVDLARLKSKMALPVNVRQYSPQIEKIVAANVDWQEIRYIAGFNSEEADPLLPSRNPIDWNNIAGAFKENINWENIARLSKVGVEWKTKEQVYGGSPSPSYVITNNIEAMNRITVDDWKNVSIIGEAYTGAYLLLKLTYEAPFVVWSELANISNTKVDWSTLNEIPKINWSDVKAMAKGAIDWKRLDLKLVSANNWMDAYVLTRAGVNWQDVYELDNRNKNNINWAAIGTLGSRVYSNWNDLTILSRVGTNWKDVDVLSNVGINWDNINLSKNPTTNWNNLAVLTNSHINWTDVAVLSKTPQDWRNLTVTTLDNKPFKDWRFFSNILAKRPQAIDAVSLENRPLVNVTITVTGNSAAVADSSIGFVQMHSLGVMVGDSARLLVGPAILNPYPSGPAAYRIIGSDGDNAGIPFFKKTNIVFKVPLGAHVVLRSTYRYVYPNLEIGGLWSSSIESCNRKDSLKCSFVADSDVALTVDFQQVPGRINQP